MIGMLTALVGTDLYDRLRRENRLLGESPGDNTHRFEPNFVPRMPTERLTEGYKRVLGTLYDPTLGDYFFRCRRLLDRIGPNPRFTRPVVAREVRALLRSLKTIPTKRYGREYLRFLAWCLRRHRAKFPEAVRLAIQGFHFEAITREALACDEIRHESTCVVESFRDRIAHLAARTRSRGCLEVERIRSLFAERSRALRRLRRRIRKLSPDARAAATQAYGDALEAINSLFAEAAPAAARALEAGSVRLSRLRESLQRDIERILARYQEARSRAGAEINAFRRELRSLDLLRREALRRARRSVRRLPEEYRPVGRLELQAFRRRLDDLLPAGAAVAAPA
jgi:hypothetical protein